MKTVWYAPQATAAARFPSPHNKVGLWPWVKAAWAYTPKVEHEASKGRGNNRGLVPIRSISPRSEPGKLSTQVINSSTLV